MASAARPLQPHPVRPLRLASGSTHRFDAASDIAPDLLRDVMLPQQLLTSTDCLDVYREMFRDRVEQLLALHMPAVRETLGDVPFRALVCDYLATHSANSADLSRVGDEFTLFLARQRELVTTGRSWIVELGRLECAIVRCASAESTNELDLTDLAEITLLDWEHAWFEPASGLELLAFDHTIDDAYTAWVHDGELRVPALRPQYVAVLRQGTQVQRAPMTRRAWNLLRALAGGTALLPAVVEELEPVDRISVERRARTWLHAWITNGFFRAVHTR